MPLFMTPKLIAELHFFRFPLTEVDQWLRIVLDIFIETKFFSIFSILFGVGFYIFIERAKEKGLNHYTLYIRRLLFLALIGFLHIVFLWYGDILLTYAVGGFLLLLFSRLGKKSLQVIISILTLLLVLLLSIPFFSSPEHILKEMETINSNQEIVQTAIYTYQEADYLELVEFRIENELIPIMQNLPFSALPALYMFLLGFYIAKKNIFTSFKQNKKLIKKAWLISLCISLMLSAFIILLHVDAFNFGMTVNHVYLQNVITLSGLSGSIFYMSTFMIILKNKKFYRMFSPFKYVGRMALTNYICQTILALFIIQSFQIYGDIHLRLGMIISIFIFIAQVVVSFYWLRLFRYGPLEWIWRNVTYGKFQPMKKN
ncbi:hypothetical protein AB990_19320 [Alkalihalobacillus pseudalcaliphilus]|nr:hypothetical protein AB990_19320 [Alkalihalobacillus pseudalcaliphilus]